MSPNLSALLDAVAERHAAGDPWAALQAVEDGLDNLLDMLEDAASGTGTADLDTVLGWLAGFCDIVRSYDDHNGYDLDAALGVISEALDAR